MPLDRIVTVTGVEVSTEGYQYQGHRWQLLAFTIKPDGSGGTLSVGAHSKQAAWPILGASDPDDSIASVLPANVRASFINIPVAFPIVIEILNGLVGTDAYMGPLRRDGTEYDADAQVLLGRVRDAYNSSGVSTSDAPYDSRVSRWVVAVHGFVGLDNPVFANRLGAQITFRYSAGNRPSAGFSTWCQLLDITASDQLEVTAGGVSESGQRYDARLRVRYDARWNADAVVRFEGVAYSLVSVAEDTTEPVLRRAYQILGLRRRTE